MNICSAVNICLHELFILNEILVLKMKKDEKSVHKFETLSDAHRAFGLPQPKHPLISMLNGSPSWSEIHLPSQPHVLGFYKISYKPKLGGRLKYGQGYYDFDEGGLLFASPGQFHIAS